VQAENKEKTETLEAFSARLGQLAGRARLKQVDIAKLLAVKPQRVGSWFQGKNFPGGEIEHALAALLGTTRDWLVDGVEKPEKPEPAEGGFSRTSASGLPLSPLETRARLLLEEALTSAAGDSTRLGWIVEQLRLHLRPPGHWITSAKSSAASDIQTRLYLDQLKREAGQSDFSKNGPLNEAPGEQADSAQPPASAV
jgi:transcriptional regulator with XRE-family HTH domain